MTGFGVAEGGVDRGREEGARGAIDRGRQEPLVLYVTAHGASGALP